jgi:phage gp29-like protein
MTDTVVRAGGSKSWEVRMASTGKLVGHITPTALMTECQIDPIVEEVIDKIKAGPYSSKQEAMNAIASYTNGTCKETM